MDCWGSFFDGRAAIRPRDRGKECDLRRGSRRVSSRESVKRRRSSAVRKASLLRGPTEGPLSILAGDTSALTVGGVDVLEIVACISARTSLSLLTVMAVSFDIDATFILRESLSLVVRMEVAGDDEGRVFLSLIMRRDRAGGR